MVRRHAALDLHVTWEKATDHSERGLGVYTHDRYIRSTYNSLHYRIN